MTDPASLKEQVASFTGKTLASQLRVLMPDIDRRVREEGVDHETIVEGLTKAGLPISLNTFRVYLYRYRAKAQIAKAEPIEPATPAYPQSQTPQNTDRNTVIDPDPVEDGNPPLENTETEPETEPNQRQKLADILDPKKSEARSDQYFNRRKPLIGRNRSEKP